MTTHNIRFFLFAALSVLGMLLYNAWREEQEVKPGTNNTLIAAGNNAKTTLGLQEDKDIPTIAVEKPAKKEEELIAYPKERIIQVKTDVMDVAIDTLGGDIIKLILPAYAADPKSYGEGYVLFDHSPQRYYIAQSGLTGEQGPDIRGVGRAKFTTDQAAYRLVDKQDSLSIDFKTKTAGNVDIIKRFTFQRGSYVINVEYLIYNQGNTHYSANFYARLKRKAENSSGSGFLGIQTFTGAAIHTPETPYKKISFKDIESKPLEQSIKGGWAAMVEHYFVSAFIPTNDDVNLYQTQKMDNDAYSVGLIEPIVSVAPGEEKTISTKLYAGPELTDVLKTLAPGLDLAVDYGILWPICQPIFWLLKKIHQFTENWGVAIILTTIVIKLAFYRLSASSYRSMGNMRKLQPRLESLKERYGEDKQKFSQAVMELYKKEKVNPVGGCLPVLIQIPVFIALYYVLLGSVELREAPFIGWITDLSAKDPYYVLPILMGASMLAQQRLNPTPADPLQAKVMMLMPVMFTFLFLNFPSGLVLYWLVNNLLSIAQQWFIARKIEFSSRAHGAQ